MNETVGSLNLKIARLEQRLQLVESQQYLSQPYPQHKNKLVQEAMRLKFQLQQLMQYRETFLQQV